MTVTIRDVAQRLNLSITTVSRALDGYSDVAETTRQLVIETAQAMGYTPNRAARALRRQRADTIGYILPAVGSQFANPFFSEFIAGLGDECTALNFDLLVSAAEPASQAEQKLYQRWVQGRKTDGIILNRLRTNDWRAYFLEEQKMAFCSMEFSQGVHSKWGVTMDNRGGMRALVAHLVACRRKRIAYIGASPDLVIQQERFLGYKDGLAAAGLPFESALCVESDMTPEGGYQAARRLIHQDSPPDAVVCINDLTAIGTMHASHDAGLKVGEDIAVTGFDGILDSAHTRPSLTTVNQPVYEMARGLVRLLVGILQRTKTEPEIIEFAPELVVRESTLGVKERTHAS